MEDKLRIELRFQLYQSCALPLSYKSELESAIRFELTPKVWKTLVLPLTLREQDWYSREEFNPDLSVRSAAPFTLDHGSKKELEPHSGVEPLSRSWQDHAHCRCANGALAPREGIEPSTFRLTAGRYRQLSYRGTKMVAEDRVERSSTGYESAPG